MEKISFDSIAALKAFVGRPEVISLPVVVDQHAMDIHAALVHDHHWLHVDPVRAAAELPFGATIVPGLLSLSFITGWYHQLFEFPGRKLALNYGFDRVRFPAAVACGSALSGRFRLAGVEDVGPDEARCKWNVEVWAAQAARPAVAAEWLMQLRY